MAEIGLVVGGGDPLDPDIDLDHLEPCVMGRFVGVDDEGRSQILDDPLHDLPARPIRGAAVLFPGQLRLADPEQDMAAVTDHLEKVASSLGAVAEPGSWVVLGSGGARNIDAGIDRQVALARLAEVFAEAQRVLSAAGLEVMLEPLRSGETNVFNSLAEGADFLDQFGLDARMVFDTFHLFSEGLTTADALPHLDRIGHVHLSGHDRLPVNQDADAVLDVAVAVAEAGYRGRWSFECRWPTPADMHESIAVTRQRLQ